MTFILFAAGFANDSLAEENAGPFLVMIGAPGAGKTSAGTYISTKYGVPAINVLEVVQDEIAKAFEAKPLTGSRKPGNRRTNAWVERNRSIKGALKKFENGELVSDEDLNASVLARLLQADCRDGFVLAGYPGSVEQAVYLDGLLSTLGINSSQTILLDIPDEVAMQRMVERGRPDDKGGFPEARLALFRSRIGPVLEYYQGEDLFVIDAMNDRLGVREELDRIINQ